MWFRCWPFASWVLALLFAVTLSLGAPTPTPTPRAIKPSSPASPPPAPGPAYRPSPTPLPTRTPTPKPAEGALPGLVVERSDGSLLTVNVVGGRLTLLFFDANKQPLPSPYTGGAVRWDSPSEKGEQKSMLAPDGTGRGLVAVRVMRRPYSFTVRLRFFAADGTVAEAHVVDLRALEEVPLP